MRLELRAIAASVLIAHLYGPVFSQEAAGSPTPLNLKPIAEFRIKSDAFPYLDGERGAVLLSGIFSQNWFSGIGGIRVLDLKTGATVAERKYKGIKCTKDWDFSPEDLILLPGKPEILVKACAGLTVVDRNDLSIKRQLTMGQLKYVISGPFGHSIRLPMTYGVGRMLLSPDGARVVVQMQPANEPHTTDIYDTNTWNLLASWPISSLRFAFSSDGRRLAIFHGAQFGFKNCGIAVLNFPSGEVSGDFAFPDCEHAAYEGLDLLTVPWDPNLLAIRRLDGQSFLWNMSTGEMADSTVLHPPGRILYALGGGMAFSPNGKWIAAQLSESDPKRVKEFTIWAVKTGEIIAESVHMPRTVLPIDELSITADSRFVMARTAFLLRIYEIPGAANTLDASEFTP